MSIKNYVRKFFAVAKDEGFAIEKVNSGSNKGEMQIDCGNKKLHAGHISLLYSKLIRLHKKVTRIAYEKVVAGRQCAFFAFEKISASC